MMLLSHDEINGAIDLALSGKVTYGPDTSIAKAQLRKVVEWLENSNESGTDGLKLYPREWQALKKEVGE